MDEVEEQAHQRSCSATSGSCLWMMDFSVPLAEKEVVEVKCSWMRLK